MKRVLALAAAMGLLASVALGASACSKKVEVQTGTKTVCSYGHTVSDDIRTIEVSSDEVALHRVETKTVVCDRHKKLETLYGDAQKAIGAGDLKTAQAKLTEIVAADTGFKMAKSQLDRIKAGQKPAPDSGTGTPSGGSTPKPQNPGDSETSVPSGSLKVWMPDSLTGFTASEPIVDVLTISRTYRPASDSKILTFVIVAEQYRTPKDAAAALDSRIKRQYTKDVDAPTIKGRTVHIGTDGKQFAAAGLTKGSVFVALEMSAKDGAAPKALKSTLVEVLNQLP